MRRSLAVLFLAVVSPVAVALAQGAPPSPTPRSGAAATRGRVSDAVRLRRLLSADWAWQMTEFPERATLVGYPGQNARWTDQSAAAIERRKRYATERVRAVRSIDRARLGADDRLNYALFRRDAEMAVDGDRFPSELLPVTQMDGVQQSVSDVIDVMPATSVAQYEDIVARMNAVPALIDQTIALMRRGLERGITPPRITLRDVPDQVRNVIVDDPSASPMLAAFSKFPASVAESDRVRLRAAADRAYRDAVAPAYRQLLAFLTEQYLPGAREPVGLSTLPDGAAWYAYNVRRETTTSLAPSRIHETGLAEVKRIRAAMDSVIASTGFKGSFADFTKFLRTDTRFFYTDSASLVRAYRDVAKRVDPELVRMFGRLPRLPYGVVTIPAYAQKSQTTAYYQQGSLEAGRPGRYFVNTYALDTRPTWEMEALTLHESVPGHHLQIALAQELPNVPEFRRFGGYTAFVEGWALYSESLGTEMGFYQDPYSKFGQLTYQMWRAVRLVLDTGLHSMGWSRDQAIRYFVENSAKTEHDITVEVDRYIVWPGQALAYKTGELEIVRLRALAQAELGARFDIRAFHDEVLGAGPLPLELLDARVREWIAARKRVPVRATG